jgi:hypothetical protein
MPNGTRLDFDCNPKEASALVQNAFTLAKDQMYRRLTQWKRDYQMYSCFVDVTQRDPDGAVLASSKIWAIIKNKVPRSVKALAGKRPYFPFTANWKGYKPLADVWSEAADNLLNSETGYITKLMLTNLIKATYGIGYMEALPYYKPMKMATLKKTPYGPIVTKQMVNRLRFRIVPYAPWQVFVDPRATGLEERSECRYIVIPHLASRREVIRLAQSNGYPGFDLEKFMSPAGDKPHTLSEDWGNEILDQVGLANNALDSDTCLILRFQSPDRYIDLISATDVLRDVPNPYDHGEINLSRIVNDLDAHTGNAFYGISETKPNEINNDFYETIKEQMIDAASQAIRGKTYYMKDAIDPVLLNNTSRNRIPVTLPPGMQAGNVNDLVFESPGRDIPATHFELLKLFDYDMDETAGNPRTSRGETAQGDPSATEIATVMSKAEERQEGNIRVEEEMFLESFGRKYLALVQQYARPDDLLEILGPEKAMLAMKARPSDIPGGIMWQFKGSQRVAAQIVKQRNWKEMVPLLVQLGSTFPGALSAKLLEVFDEADPDTLQMIIPDALMMQLKMMQGQQQQAEEREQAEIKAGGKKKYITGKAAAQDVAAETRRR